AAAPVRENSADRRRGVRVRAAGGFAGGAAADARRRRLNFGDTIRNSACQLPPPAPGPSTGAVGSISAHFNRTPPQVREVLQRSARIAGIALRFGTGQADGSPQMKRAEIDQAARVSAATSCC